MSESAIPKPIPSVWKDCKTPHGEALRAYRVDSAKRYKEWAAWVEHTYLRDKLEEYPGALLDD